ncbi:Flp1 family type IVb pilin [Sanguibacter sp. A247]|uniref:Flp1 family type IVb pilin n=1 Tax=unclassified Sanguibacter TaxID=2645534 RepID=UPI003FD84C87
MTTTLIRTELAVRSAAARLVAALRDEKGEVNIVATVLLIVLAVALIVIFQGQIKGWLEAMFGKINSGISSVG